jgi:predicted SAM-dependent methyltransferase
MIKLNLGCGDKILDGYVNVDVVQERAGRHPDVNCDIRKLDVFSDEYCDEILAVHVVEHFWRWEVEAVIKEWIRVLKPGGRMILECPNLMTACEEFLRDMRVTGLKPFSKESKTPSLSYKKINYSYKLM